MVSLLVLAETSWISVEEYCLKTTAGLTNDYRYGLQVVYTDGDPYKKDFWGKTVWVSRSGTIKLDVEDSAYPDPDNDGIHEDRWVLFSMETYMVSGFNIKVKYYDRDSGGVVYAKYAFSNDTAPSETFQSFDYSNFYTVTFVLEHPLFGNLLDGADIVVEISGTSTPYIQEFRITRLIGYYPQRGIGNLNLKSPSFPKFTPTDKILIASNFFAAWWNFRESPWNFDAKPPYYDWWGTHPWDWDPENPKASAYCPYNVAWWRKELLDMKDAGIDVFLPNFCGMTHDTFFARSLQTMIKAYQELESEGYRVDKLPFEDPKALPRPSQFLETYFAAEWITANSQPLDFSTYYGRVFLLTELRRFWFQIPAKYWGLFTENGKVVFPEVFYAPFSVAGDLTPEDLEWVAQKFSEEVASIPGLGLTSSSDVIVYILHPWDAFWAAVGGDFYSSGNLLAEKWSWGLGQLVPPDLTRYTLTVGPGYDDSHQPVRAGMVRNRAWGEWYRLGYDVTDGSFKGMWDQVLRNMFTSSNYSPTATSFSGQKNKIAIVTWNELPEGSGIEDSLEFGRIFIDATAAYNALFKKGYYKFTDDSDFNVSSDMGSSSINFFSPGAFSSLKIPFDGWAIARFEAVNRGSACWLSYSSRGKGEVSLRLTDDSGNDVSRTYIPRNMGPYDPSYNPKGKAVLPVIFTGKNTVSGTWHLFYDIRNVASTQGNIEKTFSVSFGNPAPPSLSSVEVDRTSDRVKLSWDPASTGDNPLHGYRIYISSKDLPTYRFHDSFDGTSELGWDRLFGECHEEDGVLKLKNGSGISLIGSDVGDYAAMGYYFGDPQWQDYTFEVKFNVRHIAMDWRDGVYIGFRWHDPGNHYVLALVRGHAYGEEEIHLYKIRDWQVVWKEGNSPLVLKYQLHRAPDYYYWVPLYQKWHTLRVTVKGNTFTFYIDGEKIGEVKDETDPVPSGGVVLSARKYFAGGGYTEVWFDDFDMYVYNMPEWLYMGFTEGTSFSFRFPSNLSLKVKVVPVDIAMIEGSPAQKEVSPLSSESDVELSGDTSQVVKPFVLRQGEDLDIRSVDPSLEPSLALLYTLSGVLVDKFDFSDGSSRLDFGKIEPGVYILVVQNRKEKAGGALPGRKIYKLVVLDRR